jgi:hypothetical protein
MAKRLIWTPGAPTEAGIYWFDTGLNFDWQKKKNKHPMVLQVRSQERYIFGDFGSMPINMIYDEKLWEKRGVVAKHSKIAPPELDDEDWKDYKCITEKYSRAWVKTPEGYLAFGLLDPGWHNDVGGTLVWLTHPTCAASHGEWITEEKKYKYYPVKKPVLK